MSLCAWDLPTYLSDDEATALRQIVDAQHAVVRRGQLHALGVSDRRIEHAVRIRRWQEVSGVIVVHNGDLTPVQREEVATRVGVRLVGLAARTAAAAAGLRGWPAPALEVVVPKGCTYPQLPFPVRVHESRRLTESDVLQTSPQRVNIERALIDAASWSETEKVSCGLLAAGVQQRLTTADRLELQLRDSGQLRRRALLQATVADISGGAQALSEILFVRYCKRHGLPAPMLQCVRVDASGRRRYLDATFRRTDGTTFSVEIDGGLHLIAPTYWTDMDRANELMLAAESQLRFPSWMFHADDARPAGQIRRALELSVPSHTVPA